MTKELAIQNESMSLSDSLLSKENFEHYSKLATKLATSALVAKCYYNKPQDLFLAMSLGYKIGFSVEQSMQDIVVINGKACVYGDGMLALVMAHPACEDIIEEPIMDGEDVVGYKCTVKRKGMTPHSKIFTLKMAKKAGLLGLAAP